MLDLSQAALKSKERIKDRINNVGPKTKLKSANIYIQKYQSFSHNLINALRRSGDQRQGPSAAPPSLYIAFPEKLLSKWSYLAFGPLRKKTNLEKSTPDKIEWKLWDDIGNETKLLNYPHTKPKGIFIAHGLSPLPDTILLLADIGRATRASLILNVNLYVLLADISWMSYNRSVKSLKTNTINIENGLKLCLDQRKRIYDLLNLNYKTHSILNYEKKGAINAKKIESISNNYIKLTKLLWGENIIKSNDILSVQEINKIAKPLKNSLNKESPLYYLSNFPGALDKLEISLNAHLSILRTIAKRFRMINKDTLSYYFAQFYAQENYKKYLKICVQSERNFDEPFDELEEYFKLWGEGHKASYSISSNKKFTKKRKLPAMYLPQYLLGNLKILPYSTLSLDSVEFLRKNNIDNLLETTILVSDTKNNIEKITKILNITLNNNVVQLNRLIADIISILIWIYRIKREYLLEDSCNDLNYNLEEIINGIYEGLYSSFILDIEAENISTLWEIWLEGIDQNIDDNYIPTHIFVSSLTKEDWSANSIKSAAKLIIVLNNIFLSAI